MYKAIFEIVKQTQLPSLSIILMPISHSQRNEFPFLCLLSIYCVLHFQFVSKAPTKTILITTLLTKQRSIWINYSWINNISCCILYMLSALLALCERIHQMPMTSSYKGQYHGTLSFSCCYEDTPVTTGPQPVYGHWGPGPQLSSVDLISPHHLASLLAQHWAYSKIKHTYLIPWLKMTGNCSEYNQLYFAVMEEMDIHLHHILWKNWCEIKNFNYVHEFLPKLGRHVRGVRSAEAGWVAHAVLIIDAWNGGQSAVTQRFSSRSCWWIETLRR